VKILRAFPLVAVVAVLSCAGISKPESPEDSLVVGSLVLDFPDGFFGFPSRTIASGIELTIVNTTRNYSFSVRTGPDGYYSFGSNGHDRFSLASFHYEEKVLSWERVTLENKLEVPITVSPGTVRYVGRLTITFAHPQRSNVEAGRATLWDYVASIACANCRGDMTEYIKSMDPESPWLSRDVDDLMVIR